MNSRSAALLLTLLLLLPACSVVATPRTYRGNRVNDEDLKELVVGTATKADATRVLGSPTARATFNDNEWIYISSVTHIRIGQTPGLAHQKVTVLNFDDGGVLRSVRQLDEADAKQVAVVDRATPSPGSEASFMQQLLGNIGKFSTGGMPTGDTTPGGSGAAAGNQGL